jgi:putative ABC transport system permease protein
MFKNYFKIACRNILRFKVYSFINIFGLAIGLTGSSLLFFYLKSELSFDDFHAKADRIARVVEVVNETNGIKYYGRTSVKTGPAISDEYNDIVRQTSLQRPISHIDIHWKGERISETSWLMADSSFFEVFDFTVIEGDLKTALDEPNSIVLTKSAALKYFGQKSPIGQMMHFERLKPVLVTGVIQDVAFNSHMQFDLVMSKNTGFDEFAWYRRFVGSWDRLFAYTYVVLSSPEALTTINNTATNFVTKTRGENHKGTFLLQPLKKIHLDSDNIENNISERSGSWTIVYLFGTIAIFLILIACINYINLASSNSMERAKEIGVRKASGALRSQLIYQFLSESIIVSIIALALSIISIDVLLPYFNQMLGTELLIELFSLQTIGLLLSVTVLIGFVAGSYPAFYLSSLKAIESINNGSGKRTGGMVLRKALVITQFALSIFMIATTIVISKQMNYLLQKDLGFDNERLLVIDINNGSIRPDAETMQNEFSKINGVEQATISSRIPGEWKNIDEVIVKIEENSSDSIQSYFMGFDEHAMAAFDLQIKEGENFSGNITAASRMILLNETAAAQLGGDVLGKLVYLPNASDPFEIIGVVENFNFQSLHRDIAPLVMGYWSNPIASIDYFSLKIHAQADLSETIAEAKKVHQNFDNQTAMEFHFLDQQMASFYEAERHAGQIFSIGATMTILISCMGLFGLATFIVQKRTKEIGVRKVLGASMPQLFVLLSKTFAIQVGIAFLIAVPISWYFMSEWLSTFAFKFGLSAREFLLSGAMALTIALGSVSYRVVKVALLNPARTLKDE